MPKSKLPSAVSGLVGWWRADGPVWQDSARTTGATADGDPVGGWDDVSGAGLTVTQATSTKRPLLKLNQLNGRPVVRFDGTDDFLSGGDILRMSTTSLTIFVVGKQTGNGAYVAKSQQAGNAGRYAFYRNSVDGGFVMLYAPTTTAVLAVINESSTAYRVMSGTINRTAGNVKTYLAGSIAGQVTFTPESTDRALSTRFLLGAYNGPSDTTEAIVLNGDIAEVAVFNTAVSDADRAAIHSGLAEKYGLVVSDYSSTHSVSRSRRLARV